MTKKVKCHVCVGDEVKVISGDDKGTIGRILRVVRLQSGYSKVVVDGVARSVRAVKKRDGSEPSGYKEIFRPIDSSNVKLINRRDNVKRTV